MLSIPFNKGFTEIEECVSGIGFFTAYHEVQNIKAGQFDQLETLDGRVKEFDIVRSVLFVYEGFTEI